MYMIFFLLNCEHIYTYMLNFLFDLAPTGNPWVPVNPMGMGLGTKLNPSWVMGFLMGGFCIRGHGFGMAKPSRVVHVAIPKLDVSRGRRRG